MGGLREDEKGGKVFAREREKDREIFTHHIECGGEKETDGAQKHFMLAVLSVGEECQCR